MTWKDALKERASKVDHKTTILSARNAPPELVYQPKTIQQLNDDKFVELLSSTQWTQSITANKANGEFEAKA